MEVRFDEGVGDADASNATRKEQNFLLNNFGVSNYLKVTNGKVKYKIPIEEYQRIRTTSVVNPAADSMMLGKFTPTIENSIVNWSKPGPDSYIVKAGKTSTYFNLGSEWGKIQEKFGLTDIEMFEFFNKPALDDAFASGKTIQFSHDPRKTRGFKKRVGVYKTKAWTNRRKFSKYWRDLVC